MCDDIMTDSINTIYAKNNIKVYFAPGKYDPWCVYVEHIPLDKEYFQQLKDLSISYGRVKVYNDFIKVYNIVDENFNKNLGLQTAIDIDKTYKEDTLILWIVLYMTMIAEEKKENAILKKRIKNLGVYNVLFDEYDIDYVISYMKDEDWRVLDKLMKERGI